jgi:membrane protein DedA with SNARE-associated domain
MNYSKLNTFWKAFKFLVSLDLIFPLILLLVYIVFIILVRGVVPTPEELINTFSVLYQKYGYEIIFVSAFLEALVLVNLFVPGTLAVALGVIFARAGHISLPLVIVTASLGAISGYLLDYTLGYFGFSEVLKKLGYSDLLKGANKQLKKFGKRGLAFGFILPNIASFLSLMIGTSNLGWKRFMVVAIPATLFWVTAWAGLIYALGDIFLLVLTKYSFVFLLVGLLGLLVSKLVAKERE